MGWWGAMGGPKQKGVVQYSISPFQQRAMAGALNSYIFWGYKRIMSKVPYVAPPLLIVYGIIQWGKKENEFLNSKEGHRLHGDEE